MGKLMRGLAIAVLLATVAGAFGVLYGMKTFSPQVDHVTVDLLPAEQAPKAFEEIRRQLEAGTYAGKVFPSQQGTDNLNAEDCTFVTYTVRLANKGFFPAEWIAMQVLPADGTEVLMLPDDGAHVLNTRTTGDLSATMLCREGGEETPRRLEVSCYVFGRKIVFQVQAG